MRIAGDILGHAILITGFVFVMMLVIEYLNVLTRGNWDRVIARWKWGQSIFSAFLGATPGCLGAFAVSSLYMHRILTFGSLTAAMIATCGDEAFVMLALFPSKALLIFGALFVSGTVAGILTDVMLKTRRTASSPHREEYKAIHPGVDECITFSRGAIAAHWRHCSPHRGWLFAFLALFTAGILTGAIGHHHLGIEAHRHEGSQPAGHMEQAHESEAPGDRHTPDWNWVRITLLMAGVFGLIVVVSVPDHFLDEHLWHHLVRVHVWRIFLWTLGALILTHLVTSRIDIETAVSTHRLPMLLLACLVGLIPASGPHLVFVVLYAEGAVPLSTLLANCIVQEGHGMIPLLSHSRRAVVAVKAGKLAMALAVGIAGHALGW